LVTSYASPLRMRVARSVSAVAPRIGDTIGLMLDPTLYVLEKYLQHGPVSTLKMPYQTYRVLAGPDAAAFMGSREGRDCLTVGSSWRFVEEQFGGKDSLIAVDGQPHRDWRSTLQRGYSRDAITGRYDEAVAVVDDAIDHTWRVGEQVRVLAAMQTISIVQVGTFAGGRKPTVTETEDVARVVSQMLKIAPVQHVPKFVLKRRRYTEARERVIAMAEAAITQSSAVDGSGHGGKSTLIEDVVRSSEGESAEMHRRNMLFHAVAPYLAGVETTSATATYALYLILKHPEVQARIEREVADLFGGGEITHSTLFELTPTLHGAVLEAMRLYPIASFLIRGVARDFEFHGQRIRRGERVFIGTTVSHYLDEHFVSPMSFNVDRYRGPHAPHRELGAYSPFGRGPHMCIGKGLAEPLMQITLARLLHRRALRLSAPDYRLRNRLSSSSPSPKFAVDVTAAR
jgi:cytochrome P450